MSKKKSNSPKYSPEFKIIVVEDMLKNKLGYGETARKYKMYSSPERGFRRNGNKIPGGVTTTIKRWEQIYLAEGPEGLYNNHHGGYRPENKLFQQNIDKQNLIDENRRLKMELEYLKKLDALVRAEEERNGRKPK